ncbi:unnamed protein product [Rhizoctonia solani]|uniref:Protein kinase domain-containing protein n=1 Tax=Rhizoctonia solani TaxID=456999 RepID=A0A8H3DKL7_9AGAM|nr:unnamed protein product [Rhizoctonia solani]
MRKDDINERNCMEFVLEEAENHAKLDHQNIIKFHQWFMDGDEVYLVLEHADGGRLTKSLTSPLTEQQTIGFIYQIVAAMVYIHNCGIMHRDLKPDNILLTKDGLVKITDSRVSASIARSGYDIQGTPAYMPPESLSKRLQAEKIDQWALGKANEYNDLLS